MLNIRRWHADIKPDNILLVEDRLKSGKDNTKENEHAKDQNEITFKLADPGFAKFIDKSQANPAGVPKENLLGGTETYGRSLATVWRF